jgi:Ca2+-binding EF-hand superfamily protein
MYVDTLSDAEVLNELQKHHPTAGTATNEMSTQDARDFLTAVLRNTTTLATTDPKYERLMRPSTAPRESPRKKRPIKGNQKPRVPPPVVNTVLQRCKAAGMTDSYFWRQLDRDMSNSVTKGEFEQGLKLVRLYLEESELAALFSYFDADSSGSIDFTEFQRAMGNEAAAAAPPPRWDTSNVARYRKEEEAAAIMSPRMRTPHFKEGEHRNTAGRPARLEHPKDAAWYSMTDLGSNLLNHDQVQCRKAESSSPHSRWSAMLRAPIDPEQQHGDIGFRAGAHPDGHLLSHGLATGQQVQRMQTRHAETPLHQSVPRDVGRLKEPQPALKSASARRLSNSSATGAGDAMSRSVREVLARMKKHGVDFFYLFRRFDLDQTGLVSVDEFKQGLRHVHLTIPPKELSSFFRHFDPQNAGKMNYEQLQCALRNTTIGSKTPRPQWSVGAPRYQLRADGQLASFQVTPGSTPRSNN